MSRNRILKWDNDKVDQDGLPVAKADDVFVNIFQSVSDNANGDAIDNLVNEFKSALQVVADPLFGKNSEAAYLIQPMKIVEKKLFICVLNTVLKSDKVNQIETNKGTE